MFTNCIFRPKHEWVIFTLLIENKKRFKIPTKFAYSSGVAPGRVRTASAVFWLETLLTWWLESQAVPNRGNMQKMRRKQREVKSWVHFKKTAGMHKVFIECKSLFSKYSLKLRGVCRIKQKVFIYTIAKLGYCVVTYWWLPAGCHRWPFCSEQCAWKYPSGESQNTHLALVCRCPSFHLCTMTHVL